MYKIFTIIGMLVGLSTATLVAAELQLRDEAKPSGPLVLLGDVATIHARHAVEAAELATIDLMAAPPAGESRVLRLREVQDLLAVRGVNLGDHRFSGAAGVVIHSPKVDTPTAIQAPATRPVAATQPTRPSKRTIELAAKAAIEMYLQENSADEAYDFELKLSDQQVRALAALGETLQVEGEEVIDAHTQAFTLAGPGDDEVVTVQVSLRSAPMIVVAKHSLPKGVLVHAADVRLQRGKSTKGVAEVFHEIDEVVGKETTRIIAAGQILDDKSVRRPLLVQRGEMVTVYSRAAGISVRTTARVRDDGALGDLVSVETVEQRKPFFARVSGPQQVEVFAQVTTAASPTQRNPTEKEGYTQAAHAPTPHGANAALYRSPN